MWLGVTCRQGFEAVVEDKSPDRGTGGTSAERISIMATTVRNPALEKCVLAVESAWAVLGVDSPATVRELRDHGRALEALDHVERQVEAARKAAHVPRPIPIAEVSPDHVRWAVLADALSDIRGARAEFLTCELARNRSLMTRVSEGLDRLRDARTVDDLVESIPRETCELGYDRAMFSFVDHEHWVPRATWGLSDSREARQILSAGSPPYVHVRELMEVDVVRGRRAILVTDCATNPRMHPRIWPVSQSKTYVAAPVIARNHVAAMVHLDRSVETDGNDEFDRDLLQMFCQGVGVVFDRLLDSSDLVSIPSSHPPVPGWQDALTSREHEVLRLVALGLTNAQISNRLFVGHETIKTHVRRLMKKLGVHTRTEAGAIYHESRRPSARTILHSE